MVMFTLEEKVNISLLDSNILAAKPWCRERYQAIVGRQIPRFRR